MESGWGRALTQNLGSKAIAVLTAVILWGGVLSSQEVEDLKELPLEVTSSGETMIASDLPEKVTFRISGPQAFLRAIRSRRDEPIRISLTASKPGLTTVKFSRDNIHLPIGVKLLSTQPPSVTIRLDAVRRKEVPVRVESKGFPATGYRVKSVTAEPSFVKVRGPESQLESLEFVQAQPVDVTGASGALEKEASLELTRNHLVLEGAPPRIRVELEPLSANFKIKNVDIRVLSSLNSELSDRYVTVYVRAAPEDLQTLQRNQVYAFVDLRGKPKGRFKEAVQVKLPPRVGLVKVLPEKVEGTLR
jgi:YbbR domain-containing protein